MKLLKASMLVIGITLCLAGCKKTNHNAVQENTANAATPAPAPADMNSAVGNNAATPANATGNGDRTDTGPRG